MDAVVGRCVRIQCVPRGAVRRLPGDGGVRRYAAVVEVELALGQATGRARVRGDSGGPAHRAAGRGGHAVVGAATFSTLNPTPAEVVVFPASSYALAVSV